MLNCHQEPRAACPHLGMILASMGAAVQQPSAEPLLSARADAYEYNDRFVLLVDLPGIEAQDVDIQIDRNELTVRGRREPLASAENDPHSVLWAERRHGRVERTFALPDDVNVEGITAIGQNGLFTITLPKQPKAQPRKIEINRAN